MSEKISLTKQFELIKEKRKKAQENHKAKGPVDLKDVRAQVKDWNRKNRTPWAKE